MMETLVFHLGSLFFLFSLLSSDAHSGLDIVARSCRKSIAHESDKYKDTCEKLVKLMEEEIILHKFSMKEDGVPPDRFFLFSQCLDDLPPVECRSCFNIVKTLYPGCFPSTVGRVYTDACFVRAENYGFYQEYIGPDFEEMQCHEIEDDAVFC